MKSFSSMRSRSAADRASSASSRCDAHPRARTRDERNQAHGCGARDSPRSPRATRPTQVQCRVQVVENHGNRRRRVREHDLPEEFDEPILADGSRCSHHASTSTPSSSSATTRCATMRKRVRSYRLLDDPAQVDDRDQPGPAANPQRASADSSCRSLSDQARTTSASRARLVESMVRGPLDVARTVRRHRTSDHEKFGRLGHTWHAAGL